MAKRSCFFCSSTADSLEVAWPRWLTGQFRGTQPSDAHLERGKETRSWSVLQPELTVRCVCRSCNNGWMSQLESQTKPLLQPLLMGEHSSLDPADQAILALWCMKPAMVLEALDKPELRAYTQRERERLRTVSAIPWRTAMWLAGSVDQSFFLSGKNRHLGEASNPIPGSSITMVFAHVALQVLTIRVPADVGPKTLVTTAVRSGPWDRSTVKIWPGQSAKIDWPPAVGLNGELGLNALAERFSTTALDEESIDSLAV
jgi:hypothetical protein